MSTSTAPAAAPMAAPGPPADPSGPFEGPEKLLELWFRPHSPAHSLRTVDTATWQAILDSVSCTILSTLTHAPLAADDDAPCDAYLLSESSMFVFDHKLILKTCGTTTLLYGLEPILHLAQHVLGPLANGDSTFAIAAGTPAPTADARAGAQLVERIFYSRKSFMFPDRQKGPHRDWMLEVGLLDEFFADGAAYTVGKMNGDHWLLYMASQAQPESASRPASASASSSSSHTLAAPASPSGLERPPYNDNEDQTLEILMTQLDPAATRAFYFPPPSLDDDTAALDAGGGAAGAHLQPAATTKGGAASIDEPVDNDEEADPGPVANGLPNGSHAGAAAGADRGHSLGAQTSAAIGLASLFPTAQLDAFAFEPCGYSANALIAPSSAGGVRHTAGYWTVHVTPEPECSYASFETNVRFLRGSGRAGAGAGSTAEQQQQQPHDLASLIARVVSIFQPGKMSITLFLSSSNPAGTEEEGAAAAAEEAGANAMALDALVLKGYRRTDRILYEFEGYDLTFVTFERGAGRSSAAAAEKVGA